MNIQLNYIDNSTNNYHSNQINNSLNLKVGNYINFNNDMIDYGIIIINKAYSFMNDANARAKYISESFDSKYPKKRKWSCFISPFGGGACLYSDFSIYYFTKKEGILIFC